MKKEPEATWLRLRIIRLRAALRYALDPHIETILRETVIEMEWRLEQIESVIIEGSRSSRTKLPRPK
jgi:hypothetical protein